MSVDDANALVHRIDAKRVPREVEEAHRGNDDDLHAWIGAQQCNARFEDQWRAGNRIQHLAVSVDRFDQSFDDRPIYLVESWQGVVEVVETRAFTKERHRFMTRRADVPVTRAGNRVQRGLRDV